MACPEGPRTRPRQVPISTRAVRLGPRSAGSRWLAASARVAATRRSLLARAVSSAASGSCRLPFGLVPGGPSGARHRRRLSESPAQRGQLLLDRLIRRERAKLALDGIERGPVAHQRAAADQRVDRAGPGLHALDALLCATDGCAELGEL